MPARWDQANETWVPLEDRVKALSNVTHVRIAILNGFWTAYGDSVVLLTALRTFRRRLEGIVPHVEIDLLQHPDNLEIESLYLSSRVVDRVRHLPQALSVLAEYDAYLHFTIASLDEAQPWIDTMLSSLGIDPDSVDGNDKRNHLPPARVTPGIADTFREIRSTGKRIMLFHPTASSPIRSIPDERVPEILEQLLSRPEWVVVTATPVRFSDPRFADLSSLSSSFGDLHSIIAQVDAFVAVDTCVYHVADALGIPGVVLFSTIPPQLRIKYYPRITGSLLLEEENPLRGTHSSSVASEVSMMKQMWESFDPHSLWAALDDVLSTSSLAEPNSASPRIR